MKLHEMFPSKYLKAADIRGHDGGALQVTISHLQQEFVSRENPEEQKPVLYFDGHKRGLVLNVTNGNAIGVLHGGDSDYWRGKDIELFATQVPFGQKIVDAIRVRAVGGESSTPPTPQSSTRAPAPPPPQQKKPLPPEAEHGTADDVPFA